MSNLRSGVDPEHIREYRKIQLILLIIAAGIVLYIWPHKLEAHDHAHHSSDTGMIHSHAK